MRTNPAGFLKAFSAAAVALVGLGLIVGSGYYAGTSGGGNGGGGETGGGGPELTCSGDPVTIDRPVWMILISDPDSRCFVRQVFPVANSKEEAKQCWEDQGYYAEQPNESRLCNYFFKTEISNFCNVVETVATSSENAKTCVEWTNGNTTVTDITSQVKPSDTPQFCSSIVEGGAISAACPN